MLLQLSRLKIEITVRGLASLALLLISLRASIGVCAAETSAEEGGSLPKQETRLDLASVSLPRTLQWGGFIESYYGFDFSRPPGGERAFSTHAARSNEFNINLAHLEAQFEASDYRGRLALQAGTSVQRNYEGEPRQGNTSGPDLSQHLQEARIGYALNSGTWLDAGIFFSHLGAEGWISAENLNLTRSLVADYSPYYLSGLRLNHEFTDRITFKILLVNGWQIISENNTDKSLGSAIEFRFDRFVFSYNNILGAEVSPDLNGEARGSRFRHFHNLILRSSSEHSLEWAFQFDFGFQDRGVLAGQSTWQGTSLMARYWWRQRSQALSLRVEAFADPDQVVLVTGSPDPLGALGISVGYDQILLPGLFWRSEFRSLFADAPVFPDRGAGFGTEQVTFTSSLAVQL